MRIIMEKDNINSTNGFFKVNKNTNQLTMMIQGDRNIMDQMEGDMMTIEEGTIGPSIAVINIKNQHRITDTATTGREVTQRRLAITDLEEEVNKREETMDTMDAQTSADSNISNNTNIRGEMDEVMGEGDKMKIEDDGGNLGSKNDNYKNNREIKEENNKKKRRKINKNKDIKIEKIGTYNVQGLGSENKKHLLKQSLNIGKWDLLGLSETKLKKNQVKFFFNFNRYRAFNSCNESAKEGVSILVYNRLADHVTNIDEVEGLAIKIDLVFNRSKKNLKCIQIYGPIKKPKNDSKITEIISKLDKWFKCDKEKWNIIVMGDLNEHYQVEKFINTGLTNIKGKKNRVINWLIKNDFVNSAFIKHSISINEQFTWKSGNNQSRIDYIWVYNELEFSIEDIIVYDFDDYVKSDHNII
jgi:hypothetical protein